MANVWFFCFFLSIENHDWHPFRGSCDRCNWKSNATVLSVWKHGEFDKPNGNNWCTGANKRERRHVQVSYSICESIGLLIINERDTRCQWMQRYIRLCVSCNNAEARHTTPNNWALPK